MNKYDEFGEDEFLDGAVKSHLSIVSDADEKALREAFGSEQEEPEDAAEAVEQVKPPYVPSGPEEELAWRCLAQKSPYCKAYYY